MSYANPLIFREYDIRGLAGSDFSEPFCEHLGLAYGTLLREQGQTLAAIGRDCRLTSDAYTFSLIQGIRKTGIHVINLGMCPTPLLYFSLFEEGFLNGIQVTGSHNPSEYNGFKICINQKSLWGEQIQDLKNRMDHQTFFLADTLGSLRTYPIIESYVSFMQSHFKFQNPLKVVLDAGHGVGGLVAPKLLRMLGCHVHELYCTPDGHFPSHHPDPTVEANLKDLRQTVLQEKADIGIALDGDADRLGVIDHQGKILWGDKLMIIYAQEILKQSPGATIIGEVKCSQTLFEAIGKLGGKAIMWKTGHSLIKAKIQEEQALLAGEMSGHLFFSDRYFGYDDAIYASLRLIDILSASGKTIDELLSEIPETFSTPEIRLECPDQKKFEIVKRAKQFFQTQFKTIDIDGIRIEFPDGWGLIRASNTQPVLVLRFEATTPERLQEIQTLIESHLKSI
ncbi:MAG: phosphomannomutase/phosphoglucomutase [Deltaproteobacteria bacterium]|nr:phosphomannomutase/phosphoglucomutase [Deltaproteobacteria bacterium]